PPSCPLGPSWPTRSSLDRRSDRIVLSAALEPRKKRLLIGPHEVCDRSDAGDRNELGKWIDAKLGFQFGHDKRQIERAEAECCAQPFHTGKAANVTNGAFQYRTDAVGHNESRWGERTESRRSMHA